jgi:hypothetical protein
VTGGTRPGLASLGRKTPSSTSDPSLASVARKRMVLRPRSVLFDTHRSVEDSEAFLRFAVEGYERGDFGGWGVVLKDSGAFIGTCGVT